MEKVLTPNYTMRCVSCRKPNPQARVVNLLMIGGAAAWALFHFNGERRSPPPDTTDIRLRAPSHASFSEPSLDPFWKVIGAYDDWVRTGLEESFGIGLELIREVSTVKNRFLAFRARPEDLTPIVSSPAVFRLMETGFAGAPPAGKIRALRSYRAAEDVRVVELPVLYQGREAVLRVRFLAESSLVYANLIPSSPVDPEIRKSDG